MFLTIRLKLEEITLHILNNGLLLKSPLSIINHSDIKRQSNDSFIAIVARAGTGKTALVVQLAIDAIFQSNNVLHVSLNEPLEKVKTWYKEVLNNLALLYKLGHIDPLWTSIQAHLFIMTFNVEEFSIPTLKERLRNLTEQKIFKPNVIILDGMLFDKSTKISMENLKTFSQQQHLHMLFTVIAHRHETLEKGGLPKQIATFDSMFDDIIQIKSKNNKVYIESFKKNHVDGKKTNYYLDPSTMLIRSD